MEESRRMTVLSNNAADDVAKRPTRERKREYILVSRLDHSPFQPRSIMSQKHIRDLARSIELIGLLQDLVVYRTTGNEEQALVVKGHHRLEAMRSLQWHETGGGCFCLVIPAADAPLYQPEGVMREQSIDRALDCERVLTYFEGDVDRASRTLGIAPRDVRFFVGALARLKEMSLTRKQWPVCYQSLRRGIPAEILAKALRTGHVRVADDVMNLSTVLRSTIRNPLDRNEALVDMVRRIRWRSANRKNPTSAESRAARRPKMLEAQVDAQ